jgi:hypothetical protein
MNHEWRQRRPNRAETGRTRPIAPSRDVCPIPGRRARKLANEPTNEKFRFRNLLWTKMLCLYTPAAMSRRQTHRRRPAHPERPLNEPTATRPGHPARLLERTDPRRFGIQHGLLNEPTAPQPGILTSIAPLGARGVASRKRCVHSRPGPSAPGLAQADVCVSSSLARWIRIAGDRHSNSRRHT